MTKPNRLTRKKLPTLLQRLGAAALLVPLLVAALCFTGSASTAMPSDAAPTSVYLNGREILEGECMLLSSITYVPLRSLCELLTDCVIDWNARTSTATVTAAHLTLTVQSGALYITANGRCFYTVGAVKNLGGRLYVPIRPLARAFDLELEWNAARRCVELDGTGKNVLAAQKASYEADAVYWLSRIISAEAGGEPFLGQIAVGNVVLNRVRSSSYPNTIWGVIFDRKHGTQFSPVAIGTIYQPPTESAIAAAKICLEGYEVAGGALFFMNPDLATSSWISENRPYAFTVGNHDFYN